MASCGRGTGKPRSGPTSGSQARWPWRACSKSASSPKGTVMDRPPPLRHGTVGKADSGLCYERCFVYLEGSLLSPTENAGRTFFPTTERKFLARAWAAMWGQAQPSPHGGMSWRPDVWGQQVPAYRKQLAPSARSVCVTQRRQTHPAPTPRCPTKHGDTQKTRPLAPPGLCSQIRCGNPQGTIVAPWQTDPILHPGFFLCFNNSIQRIGHSLSAVSNGQAKHFTVSSQSPLTTTRQGPHCYCPHFRARTESQGG